MCVFLVCVLVLFRASVCAFRVSELLVVRLSFVVKLLILLWSFRSEFAFSCRVLNSSFSFEFVVEIFVSCFEVDSRSLEVVFWSRTLIIFNFVSLLYSTSRNRSSNSISRISIFESSFEFKCLEFRIRLFRRLALFDFSNFDSNLSSKVSLLYSTSRMSLLYSTSRISSSRFKYLEFVVEFRIRLDLFDFSNFDLRVSLLYLTSRSRILSLSS